MNRLKGRYVAQITIEINAPYREGEDLPIDVVKKNFREGLTAGLKEELQQQIEDMGTVEIAEQYLDVYGVTE